MVDPEHYSKRKYNTKARFISYWYQVDEILKKEPESILEIGTGNGIVRQCLGNAGISVTSLDIDLRLNPDVVGTVTTLPFVDNAFDLVACYEVLEHLPYAEFPKALETIRHVSRKHVIISIPESTRSHRFAIQMPGIGRLGFLLRIPWWLPSHKLSSEHCWEIGRKGYPVQKIHDAIRAAGFRILQSYQVFENPKHRFLILEKAKRP